MRTSGASVGTEGRGDMGPASLVGQVNRWCDAFSEAVRQVDYARGRECFRHDVVSYGTRAHEVEGLDELERRQWRGVWAATTGFRFTRVRVVDWCSDEGGAVQVSVMAEWESRALADGTGRHRQGRATLLLRGGASDGAAGGLLCVHSHFSLQPTEWGAGG